MAAIGIIGTGTWGTAIAVLLNNSGHDVTLCSASGRDVEELKRTRCQKNLPGVTLDSGIKVTDSLKAACGEKDLLVLAVPSVYIRQTAERIAPFVRYGQVIVSAAKGIEEESLLTMTGVIAQELPNAEVCALSGPSHAEEVSRGLPTTCVVAAERRKTAEYVQSVFMSPVFRVYTSADLLGVEIGGALKNVIALAAGMADGLNYGDNAKAALITRGIAEITRLAVKMGGKRETVSGLSGTGDLIVTCASMHSRNRRAGILIGQGKTMKEAMTEVRMVVEGVYAARAGLKLARKYQCEMPIVEQVNRILFENKNAGEAVRELMLRGRSSESADDEWQG